MKTEIIKNGNMSCAIVSSDQVLIYDTQSALDFIATIQYETGCNRIGLEKQAIAEEFFILSTGLAGEVLQKFINYKVVVAIIGDFSKYTSKPLKDFIYECNQGKEIFFLSTRQEAVDRLTWT